MGIRYTQPQTPVGIDWSNPITNRIISVQDASGVDHVTGMGTFTGSARVNKYSPMGQGVLFGADTLTFPLAPYSGTINDSLVWVGSRSLVGWAAYGMNNGLGLTTNGSNLGIANEHASYTIPNTSWPTGIVVAIGVISGQFSGSLWLNGIKKSTSRYTTPATQNVSSMSGASDVTGLLSIRYARQLNDSEVASLSANPWQIFKSQSRRIWVGGVAGGDVTLPLGFVTETDSANSITSAKSRAIGQVSESDSAIGIGASKSVTLGLNVETNQAQAIALAKSAGLGITTETDTSFALLRSKLATIGQPIEADSANAVARSKTVTLGIVVETDSAPSLGSGVSVAIGQVVEADTAQAISKAKSKALSQVVESDSVPSIAATKTLALGLVTEIDTPLALAQASGITLGLVTESDTAPAISVTKVKVLGQVTEANTVAGIAKAKSATIGQVVEADTANPLVGNLVAVLGLVTEVEFAHSISLLKSRGLLQVTEADSVFGLTKDKVVYISQVVEVDQVFSVFSKIDYRFVESSYNTLSIAPCYNKMYIDPNYH